MKTFTVQDIMNEGPCLDYTEEVVRDLWSGKEALTFKEVCSLDINAEDRIWIAIGLASRKTVASWTSYCADEAHKYDANAAAAPAAYAYAAYAASAYAYAAYAVSAYAAYAYAAYAASASADAYSWDVTRNEERERLLTKLVEIHEAE